MSHAVGRRSAWAAPLRFRRIWLRVITFIIVVLIHIHVASSRFVVLRTLLLRCLRHAGQWSRSSHRGKRGWVVSSLRWVIAIVEPPGVRAILWALAWHLRRRHAVWGCGPTAVRLFNLLALFIIRRWLGGNVVILLPFAMSLWRCSWRTLITIAGSLLSSSLSRCWWRSTTSDTTASRRIRVMLVRALVTVTWRCGSILHDRAHLGGRATRTGTVWRNSTLCGRLTWRTTKTSRWWGWWGRHTASVRPVVGIRDTGRLGWLGWWLLVHRRLRLRVSCLRRELRWLRVVGTRSNMVCLWRWRHATTHRSWDRRWRAGRALRTRAAGRRAWRLCVGPRRFLSRASRPLRSMLSRRTNALALLIWVQLLRR